MSASKSRHPVLAGLWGCAPLLLAAAMLFWAGNSIMGKAMVGIVPPIALAFWRWTIAFLLITPFAWPHLRREWRVLAKAWPVTAGLSATGVATFGALTYVGVQSTSALNSLLLQAALPPLILLFAWIGLRERASRVQLVGVALSLAGVVEVITRGEPQTILQLKLNHGDVLILVGVVLYALYSLALRFRPKVHPLTLLWGTFLCAMVMLSPFLALEMRAGHVFHPSLAGLGGVAYVAVLPSFLAYLFFNRGVELIGSGRAGQFMHLIPVFGSLLAVLLLGEAFHLFHAIGVVLIAAGILVASIKPRTGAVSAAAAAGSARAPGSAGTP
jgi:drug/metabolite transporter (DMT)-like permease